MELYQLKSFIEVARIQNLTRASDCLHLSQSALSSQIRTLEEELDILLFERTSKGMVLTENGRILMSYATEVLDASQNLLVKASEMSGKMTGTLKVGLNTDGNFLRVRELSRKLVSTFPEVNFIFISSVTIRTPEMLRQGHIDLGFFFGEQQSDDLITEQLDTVIIRIAIPGKIMDRNKKMDWHTLAHLPWIWSVSKCPYYQVVQAEFDRYRIEPNRVIDAMDEDVIKELVLDGQGVAILRQDDADEVVAKGDVHIWEEAAFEVPLSLGSLKKSNQAHTVEAVSSLIRKLWAGDV